MTLPHEPMRVWICPDCGQWGRDAFGPHRLPDDPIDSATVCKTQPVLVELGPFFRHTKGEPTP